MITYTTNKREYYVLTPEGEQIAREGSHEARLWNALPVKGQGQPVSIKELQQNLGADSATIGQRNAFKNKWIAKDGDGFVKLVSDPVALEKHRDSPAGSKRHRQSKIRRKNSYQKSNPPAPLHLVKRL